MRPPTDSRISDQPAERMTSATRVARIGSSTTQPVTTDEEQPDHHAGRGDDVGEEMLAVGDERRRAAKLSLADQHEAPGGVDRGGDGADQQAPSGCLERSRSEEGEIGLAEDRERRDDDQHALDHHREILGLVVAIGMVGVGRLGAERTAMSAAIAVATLTMLSSASEKSATLPVSYQASSFMREDDDPDGDAARWR